jgi:hypothetical protein
VTLRGWINVSGDSERPEATPEDWAAAIRALSALRPELTRLWTCDPASVARLAGDALREAPYGQILSLLGVLDPAVTLVVADRLVYYGVSDHWAVQVRYLLGRLPHSDALRTIQPSVLAHAQGEDYIGFIRYAELLEHLGLFDGLRELLRLTKANADPEIQRIGPEYFAAYAE